MPKIKNVKLSPETMAVLDSMRQRNRHPGLPEELMAAVEYARQGDRPVAWEKLLQWLGDRPDAPPIGKDKLRHLYKEWMRQKEKSK